MISRLSKQSLFYIYILMILVIFILPNFSADGYSIIKHTTSELGAQATPLNWIMNTIFFLLGLSTIIQAFMFFKPYWFHICLITLFGLSLLLTAFFKHSPIYNQDYNVFEDKIHSLLATITGFSFTIFAFFVVFIVENKKGKIIALLITTLAISFSLLMFKFEFFRGLSQRLMFIISFLWLIFIFDYFKKCKKR